MTNIYYAERENISPHGNGKFYEQEVSFFDVISDVVEIQVPGDAFIDTIALVEIALNTPNPLSVPFVRARWLNSDMVNMQGMEFTTLHVPLSPATASTYVGTYHSRPVILLYKNTKKIRNASQSIRMRINGSAGENILPNYVFMRLYIRYIPFTRSENPEFISANLTV
jgi:hypothetical protein